MRCKVGDLAIVIHALDSPQIIGRIVRCIRLIDDRELIDGFKWSISDPSDPVWLIESEGSPIVWGIDIVRRRAIADRLLRPIRDPGDDARDETLQWLKVPSKETV